MAPLLYKAGINTDFRQDIIKTVGEALSGPVTNLTQVTREMASVIRNLNEVTQNLSLASSAHGGGKSISATSEGPTLGQAEEGTSTLGKDVSSTQKKKRKKSKLLPPASSSSDSGEETESDAESHSSISTEIRRTRDRSIKLPPFTGKEPWKVWFNRFNDVAARQKWSNEEKLDELLPRLQGQAGEFVFGQLCQQIRGNFPQLTEELQNRFRKVETSKVFGVQFSHRDQKPGETVENYAAELKRLYEKAYGRRDEQTRREDLLRRFLDGIYDEGARFHVEYVKEPEDIDAAVYEVVNFMQTRRRTATRKEGNGGHARKPQRVAKALECESSEESDSEDTAYRVARTSGKPPHKTSPPPELKNKGGNEKNSDQSKQNDNCLTEVKKLRNDFIKMTDELKLRMDKVETRNDKNGLNLMPKERNSQLPSQNNGVFNGNCYKCGIYGHSARNCGAFNRLTQMQCPRGNWDNNTGSPMPPRGNWGNINAVNSNQNTGGTFPKNANPRNQATN